MDADKLKSRIREALGAAGIPREISEQVDGIIDSVAGKKDDAPARRETSRIHREETEEDDDAEHRAAMARVAETRAKPTQKTRKPRKKK
jgi:hypothetical protein